MAQESFDQLLNAVKQAESRGQRYDEKGQLTTSPKGAQGEMQVMPKTALKPGHGVTPAQDKSPEELARVGKDYLAAMLNKYGDREKALIAYNWGPKNTDDWLAKGADPKKLPAETQGYLQKINGLLSGTKPAASASTEPTASEKMMTDALKSGMSAQNLLQEAGPGYKAAMAMMFLGNEKPETDQEDIWKEAEPEVVAEEEAPSPLASLDLTYQSPFPAQKPAPVQRLAEGGMPFTPTIGVKGTAREELDKIKADYDAYNTEVGKYNDIQNAYKTQVDAYNAAANAYNDSFYRNNGNMVVANVSTTGRGVPVPKFTYYTADDKGTLTAYTPTADMLKNAVYMDIAESPGYSLLRSSNVAAPGTAPTAPTAVAPTAPAVTQEQYQAKADAAKADAKQRQMAVNVAFDPAAYGLSMNKLFAEGGEVDHLTPQEIERIAEAQSPAFVSPKSGIGRVAGPISQALNSGEAYPAIARGVAETPYNVLGAPVDLMTMAMRPFGYKEEKPVGGSEWIKEKMTKYGIRPGEEATPTLQGFRTMGELGASAVNPGPVAAKVGQAAEKGAAFVGKEAARQMLRGINGEGMLAPISPPVALPIVRPSGGLFPTASVTKENGIWITEAPKSNLDIHWAPVLDKIVDEGEALGQAKTDALMEMFGQKLKSYYSKQAGGPNDPLRSAILGGKVKFPENSDLNDMFPKALIEAAKRKDVTALRLLEKEYDNMMGIRGHYFQREADQAVRRDLGPQRTEQMIMEQMKTHPEVVSDDMLLRYARQDISNMNPQQMKAAADEIRAKIKENPERFSTVLEPNVARTVSPKSGEMAYESSVGNYPNQYPYAYVKQESLPDLEVQMGIDKGQPLFDVTHPETRFGKDRMLLGMETQDLVDAAKLMDPKELSRMSFPELVLRAHQDNAKIKSITARAPEVERAIKAGNPMPKELSDFGVREFLPTANNYRWMEIVQPQATELQAKALGNSIAGYSRNGSYGSLSMGKAGMDSGAVRLFALYDPHGTPVTHVEYITDKVKDVKPGNANKANTITQFYGNGPLTGNVAPEKYVDQVEDLVNKLDVTDLPYSIKSLMRAHGKLASGGMVERHMNDNRRYL